MRERDEWLVIGFKAQRKKSKQREKIKKKKKKKEKRKKKKEKRKKKKLGLDPNEGRREGEVCEWCNWDLGIGEDMNFERLM